MALHEFRHVKPDHGFFAAEEVSRQRLGELGFANAGGAGEDEAGNRAVGIFQPHPGPADGTGHGLNGFVLANQTLVEGLLHVQQLGCLAFSELLNRHTSPGGNDVGDVLLRNHGRAIAFGGAFKNRYGCTTTGLSGHGLGCWLFIFAGLQDRANLLAQLYFLIAQLTSLGEVLLAHGLFLVFLDSAQLLVDFLGGRRQLGIHQPHPAAGLINQVDCLVWKEAIRDVAVAQGGCRNQGLIGNFEAVVSFVAILETAQNFDRVDNGRLAHHDRLEATLQGRVALDVFAVLIKSGGTDALKFAAG